MSPTDAPEPAREDLADLIERLRDAGFSIGSSEAIDATALLLAARRMPVDDAARLRARVRPVFCKSADQQRQFDTIFDRWWARARPKRSSVIEDPPRPLVQEPPVAGDTRERKATAPFWIIGVFWAVVALAIAGYALTRRTPAPEPPSKRPPIPSTSTTDGGSVAIPPTAAPTIYSVDRFVPALRANVEVRLWWVWTLGALPAAALLMVSLPVLVLSRTRRRRRSEPMFLDPKPLAREARRLVPPIQADISDRLARHVRSRGIDIERQARRPSLDIPRTIEATLRNHGIPTLRFSVARVHPSYLVLIDVANETDPRGRLFYQWAERLRREGLDVELLLMRRTRPDDDVDSLRVCDPDDAQRGRGRWTPLRRLRDPVFGERLIVVSDGHLFADADGRWQPAAVQSRFYRWRDRAVFTPLEPRDWSVREESLERAERITDPGFIVLPLEESALSAWTDLILTGQLSAVTLTDPQRFPAVLRKGGRRQFEGADPPPPELVERLIQQLKLYLGERGFYWLTAIAATPVVRWELTLLLGKATLGRQPQLASAESLNASLARNYRRLVRLPWLQREVMPDWLRLRLLVELRDKEKKELRELVEALLGKLEPHAIPDGIRLGFERPPGSDVLRPEAVRGRIDASADGDPIYLGYMSGLSPDQLVLRAPQQWASWATRIPLHREPGWRGAAARLRERVRAKWARLVWAGGLPHLGVNRRRLAVLGLLIVPLAVALLVAQIAAPAQMIGRTRFLDERVHQKIIAAPDVEAVAFSADGSRIASGHRDGTLQLWSARTGERLGRPLRGHADKVVAVAFNLDGSTLASSSVDGTVRFWDAGSGSPVHDFRHVGTLSAVAFDEDLSRAAIDDGALRIWDLQTGRVMADLATSSKARHTAVAFSPRGTLLTAASDDGTVEVWNASTGVRTWTYRLNGAVNDVAISPDERRLVAGGRYDGLFLLDLERRLVIGARRPEAVGAITGVAFSPDGSRVVSSSADRTLRVWDARTAAAVGAPLTGHRDAVTHLAFSRDSQQIVSASLDGTMRFWDAAPGTFLRRTTEGEADAVVAVAFSPDGRRLFSGSHDGRMRVWDAQSLTPIGAALQVHNGTINDMAFSADGEWAAAAGADGTVSLRGSNAVAWSVQGRTSPVWAVAFSADGNRLAFGDDAGEISVWAQTRQLIGPPLRGHTDRVNALAFSPDGQLLASASTDQTVRVWSLSGKPIRQIGDAVDPQSRSGHIAAVSSVTFSADSTQLFYGTSDGALRVWDVSTVPPSSVPLQTFSTEGVPSVVLTHDARRVLASGADGAIRMWDTATLEPIGSFLQARDSVKRVAVSPNDEYLALAIAGTDPKAFGIQLWRIDARPPDPHDGVAAAQRTAVDIAASLTGWRPVWWLLPAMIALWAIQMAWNARRVSRLLEASATEP